MVRQRKAERKLIKNLWQKYTYTVNAHESINAAHQIRSYVNFSIGRFQCIFNADARPPIAFFVDINFA